MRRAVRNVFVVAFLMAVGCDGGKPRETLPEPGTALAGTRATGPDSGGADCGGPPGSETDLTKEPGYTANYLHRFRDPQGCAVRLDVMMYRKPGPDFHCAPWPPEIVIVNPVGVPFAPRPRIYVRDPDGTWRDPTLAFGFDPNIALPAGARDTGYVSEAGRLFVAPDDDRFIYVVTETGTERWPRQKLVGCE